MLPGILEDGLSEEECRLLDMTRRNLACYALDYIRNSLGTEDELIEKGINLLDVLTGRTVLYLACLKADIGWVEFLVEQLGTDTMIEDRYEMTAWRMTISEARLCKDPAKKERLLAIAEWLAIHDEK